ncbi:MAG TPA: hypothetical protein VFF52_26375 [Isosphaeraceae bacterium]|nr:hypothetical protein [Isosphaeraceae bacterium]
MTGLDLESFLLVLRADRSAWLVLGLGTLGVALLVWLCWGSRRALRKCLVLSLAAHLGLVLYGSTVPAVRLAVLGAAAAAAADRPHIRQIRVAPQVESGQVTAAPREDGSRIGSPAPRLDRAAAPLRLGESVLRVARPEIATPPGFGADPQPAAPVPVGTATPQVSRSQVDPPPMGPRAEPRLATAGAPPAPPSPLPPNLAEVDRAATAAPSPGAAALAASRAGPGSIEAVLRSTDRSLRKDARLRPAPAGGEEPPRQSALEAGSMRPAPDSGTPPGVRAGGRDPGRAGAGSAAPPIGSGGLVPLERATPRSHSSPTGGSDLAALVERPGGRTLAEVPRVYQPRLVPDRSHRAQRDGASSASERAVERALDWLARHQDPEDGRWDAGIARYDDGTPAQGDDDFTVHCPPGETCFGACAYWEADTAMTGLALLTYLGAGYTHIQGEYAATVGKGFDFLLAQQQASGDLRGRSRVVGMYCHAMATLAVCEGYALTGDPRLRDAATRAVAFLVAARARDGQAWRYAPGAPVGDTSILGWVVMGLKSAKEAGIPIPDEASVRRGTLAWLDRVATGRSQGLARYQPQEPVTPTMTAEAWVCRQFLGVGGPGPASSEAAESLLRNESDRGAANFYYWYYATLALYQHGGAPWSGWNARIRDRIVSLQHPSGHQSGSWDPDDSLYGTKGGRIYCTSLAAMTLEVYYRYLRLYDEPRIPLDAGAMPPSRTEGRERTVPAASLTNPEDW